MKLLKFIPLLLIIGCTQDIESDDLLEGYHKTSFVNQDWVDNHKWSLEEIFPDADIPSFDTLNVRRAYRRHKKTFEVTESNLNRNTFNSDYNYYLVDAGDYTGMERIDVGVSGTKRRPKIIMCPSGDCIFDAFFFNQADHWIIVGIRFSGKSQEKDGAVFGGRTKVVSDHVVFHRCTFDNTIGPRLRGDYNSIQLCRFINRPKVPFDAGGAGIDAGEGEESRGNRIIGNEMLGMTDGGGVPWDDDQSSGSTPGTIIAYNYIEGDTSYHLNEYGTTVNCSEDGYDIKNGAVTDLPEDRSYFLYNISTGHRVTDQECGGSGSLGVGWLFHRRARNWLVAGNISNDDTRGINIKSYNPQEGAKDRVQNIEVRNNLILSPHFIEGNPPRPIEFNGIAAMVLCKDCSFNDNIIAGLSPKATDEYVLDKDVKHSGNLVLESIEVETPKGVISVLKP